MKRNYELCLVTDGSLTAAKSKQIVEKVTKLVEFGGGSVVSNDDWGTKDLAYPINKITVGKYNLLTISTVASETKNINDKLRLDPEVLRFLLTSKEEKTVHVKSGVSRKVLDSAVESKEESL